MTAQRRDRRPQARGTGLRLSAKLARRAGDPRRASSGWNRTIREDLTKRMQKQWIIKKSSQPLEPPKRRLHLQESTRHERRHADRSGRAEGNARRPGRSERPPRQFHRRQSAGHERRRAETDRPGPASALPSGWGSNWNAKSRSGSRAGCSNRGRQAVNGGWPHDSAAANEIGAVIALLCRVGRRPIGRTRRQPGRADAAVAEALAGAGPSRHVHRSGRHRSRRLRRRRWRFAGR